MKHFAAIASFSALLAAPVLALPSALLSERSTNVSHIWESEIASSTTTEEPSSTESYTGAEIASALASAISEPLNSSGHQSGGEQYVVLFNRSHPEPPEVEHVLNRLELSTSHTDVLYTFNNSQFRGFVANMKEHCVEALNGMIDVDIVEKSAALSVSSARTASPWGLQRISSTSQVSGDTRAGLNFTYLYDDNKLGKGVDIYVVDTGVFVDHMVFGGRARHGWTAFPWSANHQNGWVFPEGNHTDYSGHGTHVSGTAAGTNVGIATSANIIAVRVLDENGGGNSSATVAGIDWVIQQHDKRKTEPDFVGSVISMSLGMTSTDKHLHDAITAAADAGIHASVASGNLGADSCDSSPANAGGAGTKVVSVGSVGINDEISYFSNTGKCTDIFAPGEDILSSFIGNNSTEINTIKYLNGTSMACPHVTGVMAYLIAQNSTLAQDPAAMKTHLTTSAMQKQVGGAVLDLASTSTVLLNNGGSSTVSSKLRRGNRNTISARADEDAMSAFALAEDDGGKTLNW